MRQPNGRTRAHRFEDRLIVLRQRRIGNQQQHQIALGADLVHLSKRTIGLGEAGFFSLGHRAGTLAQPNHHFNVGSLERFSQILRLRRTLGRPADHTDLLDAVKCFGQQRKQISATGDDPLLGVAHGDHLGLEDLRFKIKTHRRFPLYPRVFLELAVA